MREILFRGKRLDNGEWVEGYYIRTSCSEIEAVIIPTSAFAERNRNLRLEVDEWWEVDPTTVGQDTGLTDKNGKKIFEDDIIEVHGLREIVMWHQEPGQWENWNIGVIDEARRKRAGYVGGSKTGYVAEHFASVVGNAHDNPELLDGYQEWFKKRKGALR